MLWNTQNTRRQHMQFKKKSCKRAIGSEDQMLIKGFLSWLLHFWKCCIIVDMLRPNTPFCSTSLLLTFQNLSDIIYSQGREERRYQLTASVKLLSDSLGNRIENLQAWKNINSIAYAQININSEMTTQDDDFTSVEMSNSRLSLISFCNPDSSPASFIPLFKGI